VHVERDGSLSTRHVVAPRDDARVSEFAGLRFRGTWRHYQSLALAAFERDREAGHTSTHLVAPPGSGKTLLGFEIVRRLGSSALVLAPNSAIQAQWTRTGESFGAPPGTVAAEPGAPVACLTYQALARLDDPDAALRGAAEARWAAERAAATGQDAATVAAEAGAWTGAAAQRRRREIARVSASLKREIARADRRRATAGGAGAGEAGARGAGGAGAGADWTEPPAGGAPADRRRLAALLAPGSRSRIEALRAARVRTVVLDECHHLASLWGYVVRAVLEELGEGVRVVGLTATPPDELTTEEAELYAALLGPVDFQVPTPAVVRDGHLAPYQELAWLTEPLDGEQRWLDQHETRFRELVTELLDVRESGPLDLGRWVITRLRHRTRAGEDASELPWSEFQRRHPALAAAGVRFLASAGLPLPPGAPRGEAYRRPPDLDDWVVLLEDWVLRGLDGQSAPEAAARREAVAAALRDLGYQLTRTGIRRAASDVDRLLTGSAAKPLALVEVLGAEADARGTDLRALVLCDAEVSGARPDGELRDVLDPDAGTARAAVRALAEDTRTAVLRPLLVSGRGLRCAQQDAAALLATLSDANESAAAVDGWAEGADEAGGSAASADQMGDWTAGAPASGLVELHGPGEWRPRRWVALATALFESGGTRVLVGTRAFLGEGWNAPCVNCLVDLTSAATGVSVRQMRGRSLRLDPDDPQKVASNWDVVCVAPRHAQGAADYYRFVRKHRHLHAPADDGTLEAGVGHVHPDLSPFAPPSAERFAEIGRAMALRAGDRDAARARWRIGTPYEGHEVQTLVLHPRRPAAPPSLPAASPPRLRIHARGLLGVGAAVALAAAVGAVAAGPLLLAGLLPAAGLGTAALQRTRRSAALLPATAPLDRIARAICDAYVEVGELRPQAAASLTFETRASGYLRCRLPAATPEESARVIAALDSMLGPVERPRYLVSRVVAPPDPSAADLLRIAAGSRAPLTTMWHPVPDDLGRRKDRAEVLAAAWRRWLGPAELRFTQREAAGRAALAEATAQEWSYDTQRRAIWQ
jgi:superfamily II DNA or RNA helicase